VDVGVINLHSIQPLDAAHKLVDVGVINLHSIQ
jgi:hypothetical protein